MPSFNRPAKRDNKLMTLSGLPLFKRLPIILVLLSRRRAAASHVHPTVANRWCTTGIPAGGGF